MAEIKDINKLVIKNSATIELERRKGFVNILLQGNPNLYRAWVERNNKIVIDISGESSEYSLNTDTPDYIEILKDQETGKYYINFVGPTGGSGQLISDDMTFEEIDGNTKITIKRSKFVSTDNISTGTPDYLYVNVDASGNVSIGLTQEAINKINSSSDESKELLIDGEITSVGFLEFTYNDSLVTDPTEVYKLLSTKNKYIKIASLMSDYCECLYSEDGVLYFYIEIDGKMNFVTLYFRDSGSSFVFNPYNGIELTRVCEDLYISVDVESQKNSGYTALLPSNQRAFGFKNKLSDFGVEDFDAISKLKDGSKLYLKITDDSTGIVDEFCVNADVISLTSTEFIVKIELPFDAGYKLIDERTNSINDTGVMTFNATTKLNIYLTCLTIPSNKKTITWYLTSDSQLVFVPTLVTTGIYRLDFINAAFEATSEWDLFRCVSNLGKLYCYDSSHSAYGEMFLPCEFVLSENILTLMIFDVTNPNYIVKREVYYDNVNNYFYYSTLQ